MNPPSQSFIPPFVPPLPETHCYRCGYNLKGLDRGSNCPECDQPIALTLNFGLEHADRQWLRRHARTMFMLLALPLIQYSDPRDNFVYSYSYRGYAFVLVHLLLAALATWGSWRLSMPEPGKEMSDPQSVLSRALRVASVVFAASIASILIWPRLEETWRLIVIVGIGSIVAMGWLVGALVLKLARRSGRPTLISHARIVMWALPAVSIWQNVLVPLLSRMEAPHGVVVFALGLISFGATVVVISSVALLGRMHEVLRLIANGVPVSQPVATAPEESTDASRSS